MAEAAVLAGVLKAPSRYSPASNPLIGARARRQRAGQDGGGGTASSGEEAEQAARAAFRFAEPWPDARSRASTMPSMPRSSACRRWSGKPTRSDIVVETTIDGGLQRRAQALVQT